MDSVTTFLNEAGESFAGFSLAMLVQSSVLIVILLLLDMVLRRKVRAVFRYWIWMLVLVKLVLPPSLSSPTSLGYWFGDTMPVISIEKPAAVEEREIEPAVVAYSDRVIVEERPAVVSRVPVRERPAEHSPILPAESDTVTESSHAGSIITWKGFLFAGWLVAVAAMILLLVQRMFFVRGLIAQSEDAGERMKAVLERYRIEMGLRRRVGLRLSPVSASPSVCGLTRPIILIPESIIGKLDSQHLRSVLLHELAHIKRGDLWVSLVQTFLQIVYFYNPLLWVANAVIRKVREQAVDETVLVAMGSDAEDYPAALLNISKLTFSRPALSLRLIGVVESKKTITARIRHMVSRPFPKSAKLGVLGLLAVVVIAAILLPMAKGSSAKDKNDWTKPTERWKAKAIKRTSLESFFGGWKNLPFEISPGEEQVVKRCITILTRWHSMDANRTNKNREELEAVLSENPEFFYCEFLLGMWHRDHGDKEIGKELIKKACEHAPVILVQKYQDENGEAIAGLEIQNYNIECNRVKKGYLNPDLVVKFRDLVTDEDGCVYVPVYDTVYRLTSASLPEGYNISYPKLGWFKSKSKVGLMPVAKSGTNKSDIKSEYAEFETQFIDLIRIWKNSVSEKTQFENTYLVIDTKEGRIQIERNGQISDSEVVNFNNTFSWEIYHITPDSKTELSSPVRLHLRSTASQENVTREFFVFLGRYKKTSLGYTFEISRNNGHGTGLHYPEKVKINWPTTDLNKEPVENDDVVNQTMLVTDEEYNLKTKSPYSATLPNGVTVELVGICEHPSVGKRWWRGDGSLLEDSPYDDDFGRAFPKDGEKGLKFAVKFSGMAGREFDVSVMPTNWKTTNGGRLFSVSKKNGKENTKYVEGSLDEEIVWLGAAFENEVGNCDIIVGVCYGDWKNDYRYETDRADDAVEWIEFNNVPLRSGVKTDVEIEKEERHEFGRPPENTQPYQIDPLLKKAWLKYKDWDNRDREHVVELFYEYIEKNPNSVFLAEVYYRLGSMYSNNRNHKRGETGDEALMKKYFGKALELYGDLFTAQSDAARSFLVDNSLEARKVYYEYLLDFYSNGGPKDIYPIRSIALCTEGYHPELDFEQRADFYRRTKPTFPARIANYEDHILERVSDIDLVNLAESYPVTELGRQAQHRLDGIGKEKLSTWLKALPNGVMVELVGLYDFSNPDRCWGPQGRLLDEMLPFHEQEGRYACEEDEVGYEFLVRIGGVKEGAKINTRMNTVPNPGVYSAHAQPSVAGKDTKDLRMLWMVLDKSLTNCDLEVSVASGEWVTGATAKPGSKSLIMKNVDGFEEWITISPLAEADGLTVVSFSHSITDRDVRIVVIDTEGKEHTQPFGHGGPGTFSRNFKDGSFTSCQFAVPLKRVDLIKLQTRQYNKTTFKNVSLNPDYKTDVQIEVEKTAVKSEANNLTSDPNLKDIDRSLLQKITGTWLLSGYGVFVIDGNGVINAYSLDGYKNDVAKGRMQTKNGRLIMDDGNSKYFAELNGDIMRVTDIDNKDKPINIFNRVKIEQKFLGSWKMTDASELAGKKLTAIFLDLNSDSIFTLQTEGPDSVEPIKGAYLAEQNTISLLGEKIKKLGIKSARYDNGTIRLAFGDGVAVLAKTGSIKQKTDLKAAVEVEDGADEVRSVAREEAAKWAGQGQMRLRLLIPKERVEGLKLVMFDKQRKKFVEALANSGPTMPGLDDKSCQWYEASIELPDIAMVETYDGKKYLLAGRRGVTVGRDSKDGSGLVDVKAVNTDGGKWAVEFELCSEAGGSLQHAAKRYAGHNMGVVVDGKMISVFAIEEEQGPRATITGDFTEEQAVALAEKLELGSAAVRELLVKGIDAGDLEKVKKLLTLNRNLLEASCLCTDGRGPLVEATLVRNIEIMRYLLEQGADLNAKVEGPDQQFAGETALHIAAEYGTREMVELLVSYGANVNVINGRGLTPLAKAALRVKPGPNIQPDNAIVEHLIDNGANVNGRGESGLTALTMALMMKGYWMGQPGVEQAKSRLKSLDQTIELLVVSGAQKDIFSASGLGDTERVAAILDEDPSAVEGEKFGGWGPLQMAVMGGHQETVKLLVERGGNVFTRDVSDSPFRYAALVGDLEMFKLLEQLRDKYKDRMRAGDREIYYYRTALNSAIPKGHSNIVAHLVDQERDIKAELMEYGLLEAAGEGQVEVVRILLERGAQVYASAALYKAAESVYDRPEPNDTIERYIAIAKLLMAAGADVNAKGARGSTPLLRAGQNLRSYEHKSVNTAFFELLIEEGADVNARGKERKAGVALMCAGRADNLEFAKLLLEAGADPLAAKEISGNNRTVLEIARDDGSKEMVELLAKYAEPGFADLKKRFEGTLKEFAEAITKKDDEALMHVTSGRREYARGEWLKRAQKILTDYEGHYELLDEIVRVGTARGIAVVFIARPEGSKQRYSKLWLMKFPDGRWRVLQFYPTNDNPEYAFKEAMDVYESLDSYQRAVFDEAGRLEEVEWEIPSGMTTEMPDQGRVTVRVKEGNLRFDFVDQPKGRYRAVEVHKDKVKCWRSKNLLGVAEKLKLEKGDLLLEAKDGKATLSAPGKKYVVDVHDDKVRVEFDGKVLMANEFIFELPGLELKSSN